MKGHIFSIDWNVINFKVYRYCVQLVGTYLCRGVLIIRSADILATDMLIFSVSVIGTDNLRSRYRCRYT